MNGSCCFGSHGCDSEQEPKRRRFVSGTSPLCRSACGTGEPWSWKASKAGEVWSVHSPGLQASSPFDGRVRQENSIYSMACCYDLVACFTASGRFKRGYSAHRYQYVNNKKRDWGFLGGRWHDCKEFRRTSRCFIWCRNAAGWRSSARRCATTGGGLMSREPWPRVSRLREEGREVWGLRKPRSQTLGFH